MNGLPTPKGWSIRGAWLGMLVISLAGCSTMPAFGPSTKAINGSAADTVTDKANILPFRIIDVSAATLPSYGTSTQAFPISFRSQGFRTNDEIVEVGDRLEIRIWEVAEDGLFATAGRRETVLEVAVSNSGYITLPYASTIAARGLTTAQLRTLLLESYRGQAIEPEIAVSITQTQSRSATVLGAVKTPGRAVIPPSGIKFLDLFAQTGGASQAPWELMVRIQRASASATLPLSNVLASPANNIMILPGDIIYVGHEPRRFAVYGAINRPGNIEIPMEEANLAFLLAEVGGLNDRVAQARSAFVFRPTQGNSLSSAPAAIAYRFDFSRPDALLLASMFRLEPTDITYVASADAADFQRFVSIILSPLLGTARSATSLGN
jgi:polysaccharide biosynthesis/export protein